MGLSGPDNLMSSHYIENLPINSIITGDCINVLDTLPNDCIDLVVTSPPYDDLRDYKGYKFDVCQLVNQLVKKMKMGGVVVWIVGDSVVDGSETGTSFRQALYFKEIGFSIHDVMIYAKNTFAFPATEEQKRYHQLFEFAFVFSKGKPKTFNPIKDKLNACKRAGGDCKRQKDGSQVRGERGGIQLNKYGMRGNIWTYEIGGGHTSSDPIAHKHPAIFPEQLAIDHIKSWTNEGDLVLDPMAGSFTTCVAAYKLCRNYIGIDISPEYCEIGKKRLENAKKIKAGEIF
jgi:site-specific DNA-methyltransferase (adenine-specific)